MLFAEALPDPNHFASIGWVCVILVMVIFGLRQGIGFVRDLKEKPAAGDVAREAAATFTRKTEFDQHVTETRNNFVVMRDELKRDRESNQVHASERSKTIFRELKETREKLERQVDDQTEKLEKRINRISVGVARLCGKANVPMPSEEAEL